MKECDELSVREAVEVTFQLARLEWVDESLVKTVEVYLLQQLHTVQLQTIA